MKRNKAVIYLRLPESEDAVCVATSTTRSGVLLWDIFKTMGCWMMSARPESGDDPDSVTIVHNEMWAKVHAKEQEKEAARQAKLDARLHTELQKIGLFSSPDKEAQKRDNYWKKMEDGMLDANDL